MSVVIPAYQASTTLGAAISSVLWQTYRDREIVVVDDGSTDHTSQVAGGHGESVRLVRQAHLGVAATRNRGIEEARGELIAFCDADDFLFEQYLERLVATHDRVGGISTSNAWWLLPGGIHRHRTRHKGRFPRPMEQRQAILEQNFVSTMSLFPKVLVDEIGPFDVGLRRAEDWDFWLRAIFAGWSVTHQPHPLALYRWGATGLSADWRKMDQAGIEVLSRARRRDDLRPEEQVYIDRRLASPGPGELGREADRALRAREYRRAARLYRQASALCPSERRLVWKARGIALAPSLSGRVLRARQLGREHRLGFDERHVK